MIIMHYRFNLPADYDMSVIEKHITDNGAKLDGFTGLLFKAYLFSRRDDVLLASEEKRYAPLYVWENAESMTRLLQSPGFIRLTQDFGWPQISTWLALRLPSLSQVKNRPSLKMTTQIIPAYTHVARLNLEGQLCGWDVSQWQLLEVEFLDAPQKGLDSYHIGYIAAEENPSPLGA